MIFAIMHLWFYTCNVFKATGPRLGTIASAFVTAGGSLAIAFVSGWKLALLVLAFVPFIIFGGMMEVKTYFEGNAGNLINSEEAGKVERV